MLTEQENSTDLLSKRSVVSKQSIFNKSASTPSAKSVPTTPHSAKKRSVLASITNSPQATASSPSKTPSSAKPFSARGLHTVTQEFNLSKSRTPRVAESTQQTPNRLDHSGLKPKRSALKMGPMRLTDDEANAQNKKFKLPMPVCLQKAVSTSAIKTQNQERFTVVQQDVSSTLKFSAHSRHLFGLADADTPPRSASNQPIDMDDDDDVVVFRAPSQPSQALIQKLAAKLNSIHLSPDEEDDSELLAISEMRGNKPLYFSGRDDMDGLSKVLIEPELVDLVLPIFIDSVRQH